MTLILYYAVQVFIKTGQADIVKQSFGNYHKMRFPLDGFEEHLTAIAIFVQGLTGCDSLAVHQVSYLRKEEWLGLFLCLSELSKCQLVLSLLLLLLLYLSVAETLPSLLNGLMQYCTRGDVTKCIRGKMR